MARGLRREGRKAAIGNVVPDVFIREAHGVGRDVDTVDMEVWNSAGEQRVEEEGDAACASTEVQCSQGFGWCSRGGGRGKLQEVWILVDEGGEMGCVCFWFRSKYYGIKSDIYFKFHLSVVVCLYDMIHDSIATGYVG